MSDKVERVVVNEGFLKIIDEGIKKNLKALRKLAKR